MLGVIFIVVQSTITHTWLGFIKFDFRKINNIFYYSGVFLYLIVPMIGTNKYKYITGDY